MAPYSPLGGGLLTGKYTGQPMPIVSARDAAQLAPSLAAIGLTLPAALSARLSALSPAPPPAADRLEEARG